MHPAYVAGILDGEGCISIRANDRGDLLPSVEITMSEKDLLELFAEQYGGEVKPVRAYWTWRRYGQNGRTILRDALPYLTIKRRRTELVLEFLEQHSKGSGPPSAERTIRRREIYELVKAEIHK